MRKKYTCVGLAIFNEESRKANIQVPIPEPTTLSGTL